MKEGSLMLYVREVQDRNPPREQLNINEQNSRCMYVSIFGPYGRQRDEVSRESLLAMYQAWATYTCIYRLYFEVDTISHPIHSTVKCEMPALKPDAGGFWVCGHSKGLEEDKHAGRPIKTPAYK